MLTTQLEPSGAGVASEDGRRSILVKRGSSEQSNARRRRCLSARCAAETGALAVETSRRPPRSVKSELRLEQQQLKIPSLKPTLQFVPPTPLPHKDNGGVWRAIISRISKVRSGEFGLSLMQKVIFFHESLQGGRTWQELVCAPQKKRELRGRRPPVIFD